jgi:hypothetical protein
LLGFVRFAGWAYLAAAVAIAPLTLPLADANVTSGDEQAGASSSFEFNEKDGTLSIAWSGGRAGILAHSYMLGPNGQSNGCVSFSDYPEFLNAFLRGEVTRLVVVERLESPPGKFAAGQLPDRGRDELKADRSFQYAAASY